MGNKITKENVYKIIENLEGVYWQEINYDNSYYEEALRMLKELCLKYGIAYEDNIEKVFNKFIYNKEYQYHDSEGVIKSVNHDLEKVTDISLLYGVQRKYKDTLEFYRVIFEKFVKSDGTLKLLLNDEISLITLRIASRPSLEERSKPREFLVCDEDGWPIMDENGNEVTRLETSQEITQRLVLEDKDYAEDLESIGKLKEALALWMEYLIILPKLSSIYKDIKDALDIIKRLENQKTLEYFNQDEDFMNDLYDIMAHDINNIEYLYHGTQTLGNAEKILNIGLFLASNNLDKSTYSEFTPEELLVYKRGFDNLVGSEAVVIIKRALGTSIVRKLTDAEKSYASSHIIQSGLGGLDGEMKYVIPKEYIVGYVDKINKKVVYGDAYRQREGVPRGSC